MPARKAVSILLCIVCLFIPHVFAETNGSWLLTFQDGLKTLLSILSRWWIILATLAGKLMTNDRVYGAALHMDIYLWKLRNIMKNFANFALVGIVLWSIIKSIIGKDPIKPADIIKKTLIAGILIQASRFLVWALVDLSTVAVSAVASFPATFIQWNTVLDGQIQAAQEKMKATTPLVDLSQGTITSITNQDTTPVSSTDALASILPNSNSVSGPLIYMGMSVFGFYKYLDVGTDTSTTIKDLTINFSLKTIVLVFYTIGLLLLFVANLIRVVFLWFFIIAAPFIVLLSIFKSWWDGKSEGISKYLSFSSLMDMIFKPVIYIAVLSMILIFITSIQNIMSWNPPSLNGVSMTSDNTSSTLSIQDVSSVKIDDTIFSDIGTTAKNTFADLIVFFLAIFLTWQLVKLSVKWSWPIEKVTSQLTWWMEKFASSIPLVGGFSAAALGPKWALTWVKKKMLEPLGINAYTGKFQGATDEYTKKLEKFWGMQQSWKEEDYKRLRKTTRPDGLNFFDEARQIAEEKNWITLWDPEIKKILTTWLEKRHAITYDTQTSSLYNEQTKFDTFFGKEPNEDTGIAKKNRWILHNLLWGDDNDNAVNKRPSPENPPTYNQLMQNIYHRKPT